MKMNLRLLSVLTLTAFVSFTACKKDSDTADTETQLIAQSDDQAQVSTEMDGVSDNASVTMESNVSFGGRTQNPTNTICDAAIALNTSGNPRTITLTYNGANCDNGRIRTGAVVISMDSNMRWKDVGAAVTVTYQNFKVKRTRDNKSITLNGSQTITNVLGGGMADVSPIDSVIHTITSNNITITFDDGSQRLWNVAKKRTFTYNNGLVVSIRGIHIEGNNTKIAEWGTTRFGKAFTSSILEPVVVRQDCSFRITSGQIKHDHGFASATATFGLNADGIAIICPVGSFYYKLVWTGPGGNSATKIIAY